MLRLCADLTINQAQSLCIDLMLVVFLQHITFFFNYFWIVFVRRLVITVYRIIKFYTIIFLGFLQYDTK